MHFVTFDPHISLQLGDSIVTSDEVHAVILMPVSYIIHDNLISSFLECDAYIIAYNQYCS